jgi:hypothetical protein
MIDGIPTKDMTVFVNSTILGIHKRRNEISDAMNKDEDTEKQEGGVL